ncbi:hypothetical protein C7B76_05700 [filamentous cyanobacterium CCP2]|nr:hypothetical protein C7B76_05700 [filamentous cyanobacterium CCP2]
MQNTRLNDLVDRLLEQFNQWIRNPWRRISVIIISLLLGNFVATVVSTVAGQRAELDVYLAMLLLIFTEITSWLVYRGDTIRDRRTPKGELSAARPLFAEMLNCLKIGLVYGLFVEAFKLGS